MPDYEQIQAIKAELDEEFNITEGNENNESNEVIEGNEENTENEEVIVEEELNETDLTENVEEATEEVGEEVKEKPTKPQHKNVYRERDDAQRKLNSLTNTLAGWAMASGYGNDIERYVNDVNNKQLEREAETQNINPEIYKKMRAQDLEIANLKALNQRNVMQGRIEEAQQTIEKFGDKYNLQSDDILKTLYDGGINTVDKLVLLPNLDIYLKGALQDKILANERDGVARKVKKLASAETSTHDTETPQIYDEDKALDAAISKFAKANGYN